MRFEGNSRGINRSDYEQFAGFLGLGQPRYTRDKGVNANQSQVKQENLSETVGMVYGVKQDFVRIYEPEIALENGTIFEELNKPFYPIGCKSKGGEGCL